MEEDTVILPDDKEDGGVLLGKNTRLFVGGQEIQGIGSWKLSFVPDDEDVGVSFELDKTISFDGYFTNSVSVIGNAAASSLEDLTITLCEGAEKTPEPVRRRRFYLEEI